MVAATRRIVTSKARGAIASSLSSSITCKRIPSRRRRNSASVSNVTRSRFPTRLSQTAYQDINPKPRSGSGKSGLITIDAGGAEVLERTSVVFEETFIEARIELGLPANGRRVLGRAASELLIDVLPRIVASAWIDRSEAD